MNRVRWRQQTTASFPIVSVFRAERQVARWPNIWRALGRGSFKEIQIELKLTRQSPPRGVRSFWSSINIPFVMSVSICRSPSWSGTLAKFTMRSKNTVHVSMASMHIGTTCVPLAGGNNAGFSNRCFHPYTYNLIFSFIWNSNGPAWNYAHYSRFRVHV